MCLAQFEVIVNIYLKNCGEFDKLISKKSYSKKTKLVPTMEHFRYIYLQTFTL